MILLPTFCGSDFCSVFIIAFTWVRRGACAGEVMRQNMATVGAFAHVAGDTLNPI